MRTNHILQILKLEATEAAAKRLYYHFIRRGDTDLEYRAYQLVRAIQNRLAAAIDHQEIQDGLLIPYNAPANQY